MFWGVTPGPVTSHLNKYWQGLPFAENSFSVPYSDMGAIMLA